MRCAILSSGLDEELPQLIKSHRILDVGKLGVVVKSSKIVLEYVKIVLQPGDIQFNLYRSCIVVMLL